MNLTFKALEDFKYYLPPDSDAEGCFTSSSLAIAVRLAHDRQELTGGLLDELMGSGEEAEGRPRGAEEVVVLLFTLGE